MLQLQISTHQSTTYGGGAVELHSLQQGRGLAAMAVVAYHLSLLLALPRYLGQEVFSDLSRRGNLGVDFFFVLSGFIIAFAHHHDIGRPDRLRSYLTRRFSRVFPIYWVYVGAFCALVAMGFGANSTLPNTLWQWASTALLIRIDSLDFPIAPAWTLVHEVAFYLVFALFIISRSLGRAVFALWMLICMLSSAVPNGAWTPWTTYTSTLNLNFLVGMLAFACWANGRLSFVRLAFFAGLASLIAIYMLERADVPYRLLQVPYAVAFGLMIAGAGALESGRQWPSNMRLLNLIGDASYSIYLTHVAVQGMLSKILIWISAHMPLSPKLIYILAFAGTVTCGCLLHLLVERPLIKTLRKNPHPQNAQFIRVHATSPAPPSP